MDASQHHERLKQAVVLACGAVEHGGGPFGALVVRGDRLLASAHNQVTQRSDPTAHAEIMALREACALLGSFRLDGCSVYASCEPCPMCLSAMYWARVDRVYYASSRLDAADAGFDDGLIYQELDRQPEERRLKLVQLSVAGSLEPFEAWRAKDDKQPY
ncbi:MAG: nucleoside deaminase [Proteobacteria bacterium]|nr:nucleoside deaminase [Pseudomonadota bacterium]